MNTKYLCKDTFIMMRFYHILVIVTYYSQEQYKLKKREITKISSINTTSGPTAFIDSIHLLKKQTKPKPTKMSS